MRKEIAIMDMKPTPAEAPRLLPADLTAPSFSPAADDPFDDPYAQRPAGHPDTLIFYQFDHPGNTRLAYRSVMIGSEKSTELLHTADYYPFGRSLRTWSYTAAKTLRYQSTGHVERSEIPHPGIGKRDRETGLAYRLARFHDSDAGRFLSTDPLADAYPGFSPYNYTLGNPVRFIDPDGRAVNQYTYNIATGEYKQINNIGGDEEHTVFTIYGDEKSGFRDYAPPISFSGSPPRFAYSFTGGVMFSPVSMRDFLVNASSSQIAKLMNSNILNDSERKDIMAARVRASGKAFQNEPMGAVFMGFVYQSLFTAFGSALSGSRAFTDYGLKFEGASDGISLIKTKTQLSKHSIQRMAQRGVTPKMAQTAINKGLKFYDPLNKSINYILPNGFGSGKSLLVGTNPLSGEITTVLRSSKNLIKQRLIPIK